MCCSVVSQAWACKPAEAANARSRSQPLPFCQLPAREGLVKFLCLVVDHLAEIAVSCGTRSGRLAAI